jgi:7,8-dihydropterin-6-yl-methyl-4-(beta-D-ribofuranosyl)aminobenzene 5'-phosphate synthase
MKQTVTVTTLVENSVHARRLCAEHGLSFHVQARERSLLFDTGQSGLLVENARKLRVPLERIGAIALSHGHDDHTGGLQAARAAAPRARVFLHPASLAPKFAGNPDGTGRPLGIATSNAEWLRGAADAVVWTAKQTEVMDGIFVTGEIPRRNDFEDTGGRFYLDAACTRPDPLVDDQALFFDTSDGLVVLLGCGHSGVVNTLEYIGSITGGRPIHALIGGMHLLNASPERMEKTLAALRRLDVRRLAPAHCTGMPAAAQLWTAFPGRCSSCGVGTRLTFQA